MLRTCSKVQKDDDVTVFRTRLEGPVCEGDVARREQLLMLRAIADDLALTACGVRPFETLTMRFVDSRWVVTAEAEVRND